MEADVDMLKRVARILGESCAAQDALDKAAEYTAKGWAVKYWFSDDNHIVVEGIDPEKMRLQPDAASGQEESK